MPPDTAPRRRRDQARLAVGLAWVAGGVDAIGFLTLAHLFTAHMSGNSVAMAAYAGQGQWPEALRRAFPIPAFAAGVMGGAALMEGCRRKNVRAPGALALALEAALLLAFLLWQSSVPAHGGIPPLPTWRFRCLAALLPLAMGLQNAALRRVGGKTVRTTYISGNLTDFAEGLSEWMFRLRDRAQGRSEGKPPSRMALAGCIWLGYIAGAAGGSLLEGRWAFWALTLPLAGLLAAIGAEWRQPLEAAAYRE